MGKLVEIAHFHDPEEAFCARSYLAAHGVAVIIKNEHHLTANPSLRIGLGGYPLLALDRDAETAEELLNNRAPLTADEFDPVTPRKRIWLAFPMGISAGFVPLRRNGWLNIVVMIPVLIFLGIYAWVLGEMFYKLSVWLIDDAASKA